MRVLVTGLGLISSIGNDAASATESLRTQRHGIEPFPPFQQPDCPPKVLGTIKGFNTESRDPEDWTYPSRYRFRRETVRSLSPHVLHALCAMQQAVEDSGLKPDLVSHVRTGLYTASGGSGGMLYHSLDTLKRLGVARTPPLSLVASVVGTLNYNLVAHHKILGSSCGFASACASSAHALGFAFDELSAGRQDRMFVVGAEDGDADSILPFAIMRALSVQADPAKASRPFDRDRDGFVGTGGASCLLLETEASFAARGGTRCHGEILGWGQASDGHSVATPHPDGRGLALAMRLALERSGVAPGRIDYINAHATSTALGDVAECRAVRAVLGERAAAVPLSSTKALTGHGLSLAGALEAALVLLSMGGGFTPGNPHLASPDPACEGVLLERDNRPVAPTIALSNNSGFGGANVSLVLRRTS
jgi:3-oxoacyl-[acyl-carrier-protein] synthase-1